MPPPQTPGPSQTQASGSPLAELAPDRAPPDIARIYAEICRLSGVTLPALIWRHLATWPGVLPAVWSAVGPIYERGLVQETAWRSTREALAGRIVPLSATQLQRAGLPPGQIAAYGRVLASYNRTNPINFVTVRLLARAMADAASATPGPVASSTIANQWTAPAPIVDLPPMTALSAIPADVRRLIDELGVDLAVDRSRVVPSLYRHLVGWPALLEAMHAAIVPHIRSGAYEVLRRDVAARLETEAAHLAGHVPPIAHLTAVAGLAAVLDSFSGLIPEMIVIGGLLQNGLEAPAA